MGHEIVGEFVVDGKLLLEDLTHVIMCCGVDQKIFAVVAQDDVSELSDRGVLEGFVLPAKFGVENF